ncbi:MAG: hypothetical protein ACI8XB_000586 [Patiriisocius sp.]
MEGETYTANSGQLLIAENDFFNASFVGSFEDLTLIDPACPSSVNLNGTFNLQYE